MKKYEEFEVSYNEMDWAMNDNDVLKSVKVLADGEELEADVIWDNKGAYVLNGKEKIYVLENCK